MAKKRRSKRSKGRKWAIDERIVKALTHALRVEILGILNERIASPNELSKELNEGLSQVSYHVKVLRDFECIELVKTEPRRGAVEHYYRATSRAFLTDRDWYSLPDSIRPGLSASLLELVVDDAASALEQGSLDERKDRHMSRTPLIVDETGWKDLTGALNDTLKRIEKVQKDSSARLRKSGEKGISVTAAMMGFELPESRDKGAKAKRRGNAKTTPKRKRKKS